jgi:UDPglucose--hexose-1-phosphate uridylyltransferase
MPELRTDWLTGRTVLIAENRALRPDDFSAKTPDSHDHGEPSLAGGSYATNCPFCAGNESRTPPAVYEQRDVDDRWIVRVVPNAYPAVDLVGNQESELQEGGHAQRLGDGRGTGDGTCSATPFEDSGRATLVGQRIAFSGMPSPVAGAHEVIIESPIHAESMGTLSLAQLRAVLDAYTARLRYWRENAAVRYGLLFKNQGPRAGASLAHVHSQLIALPFIPTAIAAELDRATQHWQTTGKCAYCERIDEERAAGSRIVFEHDGLVAFCPFASWQPHEVWLMPVDHEPSFELQTSESLDRTCRALHLLISRLEAVVPGVHYNMLLRTSPFTGDYATVHHWRIELLPRANSLAGLEVATGIHINPLPPERASSQLRLR